MSKGTIMKKTLLVLIAIPMFISTVGLICSSCGSGHSEKSTTGTLAPKDFAAQLKANPDIILLDVRTPEELASGYLIGARNLDFNAPGFQDSVKALDPSKTYFVYCASGKRSGKAMEMMQSMGFQKVGALDGGIRMWNANGLPIEQPNQ